MTTAAMAPTQQRSMTVVSIQTLPIPLSQLSYLWNNHHDPDLTASFLNSRP